MDIYSYTAVLFLHRMLQRRMSADESSSGVERATWTQGIHFLPQASGEKNKETLNNTLVILKPMNFYFMCDTFSHTNRILKTIALQGV